VYARLYFGSTIVATLSSSVDMTGMSSRSPVVSHGLLLLYNRSKVSKAICICCFGRRLDFKRSGLPVRAFRESYLAEGACFCSPKYYDALML